MLSLCAAALACVATILGIAAPWFLPYLGSAFSPAKLHFTEHLLYVMLPFVLFNGISLFAGTTLNAGEKFAAPALVPVITPVVTVGLIFMVKSWGVYALAIGTVGGSLLEAALVFGLLRSHGMSMTLKAPRLDPAVRRVLGQFFPVLGGTFLMGGTAIVDQSMAAMLPSGSVAALSFGSKVVGLILAIAATALSTAALPYFSQMTAARDWNGCRHTLKKYSLLVGVMTVPLTAGLVLFSRPVIALLFQRGAFTSADTDLVSRVQSFYALQIPFYICGMLFVRFLSAMRRNELLMYGSTLNLVLDIVLNLIFIKFLGIAGIALSTAAVMFSSCLFVVLCSMKLLRESSASLPRVKSETAAI
jgi:putative peptidoglycan lipid II flippase